MKKLFVLLLVILFLIPSFAFTEKAETNAYSEKEFSSKIKDYSNDELLSILNIALAQLNTNKYLDKDTVNSINKKLEIIKINAQKDTETAKVLNTKELSKIYQKLDYKKFFRNPDKFKDEKYVVTGRVLQVMKGDGEIHLRIGTKKYDDVVYVVMPDNLDFNIIEKDTITLYCTAVGIHSYTAVRGNEITIPLMTVDENTPVSIK